FTSQGHVLVNVECEHRSDQDAKLRISVTDTGIGIPEEKIDSLFERFTQADSSTTRRYGGTGLGLAICKQLVELMDGTIGVTSKMGEGSTFWIRLTLPLTTPPLNSSGPEAPPLEQLRGRRMMIVDHNEFTSRVLREQVEQWGMRSEAYTSGGHALETLRQAHATGDPFDMVITEF